MAIDIHKAGNWLFYCGLTLFLLGGHWYSDTGVMPHALTQAHYYAGLLGRALLFLRLLSLLPQHPRYTIACTCLLVVLKFSKILSPEDYTAELFHTALIISASRGTEVKVSLRIFLVCILFYLFSCPLTLALGWSQRVSTHLGSLRGSSMGFMNPNFLAQFIMTAVFLWLVLTKETRIKVIWPVCWAMSALTFFITLCLTTTFLLLVMPLVYLIIHKRVPKPTLMALLPPACLLVSVVLAALYGPGYGSSTFESRFSIPALVFQKYGLSPFGQDCGLSHWFGGNPPYKLSIDNVYLNICLCHGIVVGVVVMALYSWFLFMIGRKGDPLLSAIACCIAIAGLTELLTYNICFNFTVLFFPALLEESSSGEKKAFGFVTPILALVAFCYAFWPWPARASTSHPYGTIGDIAAPEGFVATRPSDVGFSGFLESLPLARADSLLTLFDGTPAEDRRYQCYRIVDHPLIDNNEQCADVCMRLWAEYLYGQRRFGKISFLDTRGKTLRYHFGACSPTFKRYLKEVFSWCNTESLRNSLADKKLEDIAPGDIFIYDKASRPGETYGHAVMIARTAVDTVSGRQAVLLVQGSTPACDVHIVGNTTNPELSPWHLLNSPSDSIPVLTAGKSMFYKQDLRSYQ